MTDDIEDLQVTYLGAGTFKFGDSAQLSTRPLDLVREGKKRATCGALAEFKDDPDVLPVIGRTDIAADWGGIPALVIKTLKVEEIGFCDVTEEMALVEGEDEEEEETLAGWRKVHEAYFTRKGGFDPEMMLVFEHFDLIEDLADR